MNKLAGLGMPWQGDDAASSWGASNTRDQMTEWQRASELEDYQHRLGRQPRPVNKVGLVVGHVVRILLVIVYVVVTVLVLAPAAVILFLPTMIAGAAREHGRTDELLVWRRVPSRDGGRS